MLNFVYMPTKAELAKLSHSELNACIKVAFYQWQATKRTGADTAESQRIYHTYDNEQLKRLEQLEKRLLRCARRAV